MHIIQGSHNAYHANCRGRGQAELDWRNVDTVLLWGINVQASLKVIFGWRINNLKYMLIKYIGIIESIEILFMGNFSLLF